MPVLTKINTNVIADDAVTSAKIPADAIIASDLAPNITLTGDYVGIPSATTTERDALTAAVGMLIYNSTIGMLQQYNSQGWASIDSPPTVSSLDYPGDDTALDTVGEFNLTCTTQSSTTVLASSTTGIVVGQVVKGTGIPTSPVPTVVSIITNTSFVLSGAATASASVTLTFNTQTLIITGTNFQTGATVTIDGTAPSTVTKNSSTQITVTGTPAKTAGTKVDGLVVSNLSGLSASINVDYSPLPGWSSPASGNVLSSLITGSAISTIDLVGGSPATTSYALSSGSLPPGLAMSTSTGDITGTITGSTYTTYNFTVNAIDAQAQSSPRLFNIIVSAPLPTGGTITTYSGYRVHSYLIGQTGQYFTPSDSRNVDILLVAGGGSGGSFGGGGGGAGGFVTYASQAVTAQAYTITVGDGAAAPSHGTPNDGNVVDTAGVNRGAQGGNSQFGSLTAAVGGGGGGSTVSLRSTALVEGGDGGSGGGTSKDAGGESPAGLGGTATSGQGSDGGTTTAGGSAGGSGGGGAGAAGGGGGALEQSGAGGAGTANSYRLGTGVTAVTYAGGGGGSTNSSTAGKNGAGGNGGGGAGALNNVYAVVGTDNNGGGGGGGAWMSTAYGVGAAGGSGIVVIRYAV